METADDDIHFQNQNWRIYYLTAIFIISSLIQWILLVNFESFEFLLNSWLVFGAFITLLFIVMVYVAIDFADKTLPDPLQWIFRIFIVEIFVIGLSKTIYDVNNLVLYCVLTAILIFMVLLLAIGVKINVKYLPILVFIVFSLNMLFVILVMTLMIIAKFFVNHYAAALLMVAAIAFPILVTNTLFVALLIQDERYEIKTLTDCLKPALYVYLLFASFVWFTLSSAIAITAML